MRLYFIDKVIDRNNEDRQLLERNIEAHSCNGCCSGKAINITYSEYVFVDLGIQHAMNVSHVVTCGLTGCTILLPIIS